MYAKCGALLNVCGSQRVVGKGKKSMMKLRIFGSVHVLFKSLNRHNINHCWKKKKLELVSPLVLIDHIAHVHIIIRVFLSVSN